MADKKTPAKGTLKPPRRDSVPAHRRKSTVKMPSAQRATEKTPLDVKLQREIAILTERMAELQKRLARKEEENERDADFIGKLLAEIADRDRKLKEARAASTDAARMQSLEAELSRLDGSYAEAIADLETTQDRLRAAQDELTRLRLELELERTARTGAERALEVMHASLQRAHTELEARGATKDSLRPRKPTKNDEGAALARTDLAWLLEVLVTVGEETKHAAATARGHLEDARKAFDRLRRQDDRGAGDAHASIVATLRHAAAVEETLDALQRATVRASAAASESWEDGGDERAVEQARSVVLHLWRLRDALGPLVPRDEELGDGAPAILAPQPPRRMRSRMPPAR